MVDTTNLSRAELRALESQLAAERARRSWEGLTPEQRAARTAAARRAAKVKPGSPEAEARTAKARKTLAKKRRAEARKKRGASKI